MSERVAHAERLRCGFPLVIEAVETMFPLMSADGNINRLVRPVRA